MVTFLLGLLIGGFITPVYFVMKVILFDDKNFNDLHELIVNKREEIKIYRN